jgi:hypothetical protein
MGLPVLLAVLQEDRDDVELLKGALEVLQLTVALPDRLGSTGQLQLTEVGAARPGQYLNISNIVLDPKATYHTQTLILRSVLGSRTSCSQYETVLP